MKDDKIKHLRDENARLKKLLAEVVEAYGDRGYHGDRIFTRDHQPGIMRRVMDAAGDGRGGCEMIYPNCGKSLNVKKRD